MAKKGAGRGRRKRVAARGRAAVAVGLAMGCGGRGRTRFGGECGVRPGRRTMARKLSQTQAAVAIWNSALT